MPWTFSFPVTVLQRTGMDSPSFCTQITPEVKRTGQSLTYHSEGWFKRKSSRTGKHSGCCIFMLAPSSSTGNISEVH